MTPEGRVKAAVKRSLAKFELFSWWPVPSGYGESGLDCVGWVKGRAFAIETKSPGKHPTPRQGECIRRMKEAGAEVFVIDGKPEQLRELEVWLTAMSYPTK